MFTLFLVVAIAMLLVGFEGLQSNRAGRAVLGGLCLLLGSSALLGVSEPSWLSPAGGMAHAQEVEASSAENVPAEIESTDAVGDLSDVGDNVPELETARDNPNPELDHGDKEQEDVSTPIERMTDVQQLDAPFYPEWLKEARDINRESSPATFTLTSMESSDDVRFAVVEAYGSTTRECQRGLDEELRSATNDYINEYLNSNRASLLVRYSPKEIRSQLLRDTFVERLAVQGKDWRQANALLGFDNSFRRDLDERWGKLVAGARLMQVGLGAGVVLLLLGTLFGYFRFDTATRGYYTGRLQFATFGAILAVLAAGVLVARWIPWM